MKRTGYLTLGALTMAAALFAGSVTAVANPDLLRASQLDAAHSPLQFAKPGDTEWKPANDPAFNAYLNDWSMHNMGPGSKSARTYVVRNTDQRAGRFIVRVGTPQTTAGSALAIGTDVSTAQPPTAAAQLPTAVHPAAPHPAQPFGAAGQKLILGNQVKNRGTAIAAGTELASVQLKSCEAATITDWVYVPTDATDNVFAGQHTEPKLQVVFVPATDPAVAARPVDCHQPPPAPPAPPSNQSCGAATSSNSSTANTANTASTSSTSSSPCQEQSWIYIIIGLVALLGIGGLGYFLYDQAKQGHIPLPEPLANLFGIHKYTAKYAAAPALDTPVRDQNGNVVNGFITLAYTQDNSIALSILLFSIFAFVLSLGFIAMGLRRRNSSHA